MSRNRRLSLILAASWLAQPAAAAESIADALKGSKVMIDWRVRFESVEQEEFAENAEALTSRLRAGFRTAELKKTSLLAEAVWLEDAIDDYNSTTNGKTAYPVVPDPTGFVAINRFAFTNKSLANAALTIGRQRIVHDDARFVGNVVWRQHEQTYDGVRAELGGSSPLTADLTYAYKVNRVLGPDSAAGKWDGDILLASVARAFDWGRVSAFAYGLDLKDAPAQSSNTVGVKVTGSKPLGGVTGTYALSYAHQTDAGRNPADFDADYRLVEGGVRAGKYSVALGREVLGSANGVGFSMPLATLHAFQGWADKFLATPAAGIKDDYLRVTYSLGQKGPLKSLNAVVAYRELRADAGDADYGDETDFSLVAQIARLTFLLKYATYSADGLFTDTDKLWLSMEYSF